MMRWWSTDDYTRARTSDSQTTVEADEKNEEEDDICEGGTRKWKFTVRADTVPGETVCVTGNCEALGNWKHDQVVILTKIKDEDEGNEHVWTGVVRLPATEIEYRYVTCIIVEPDGHKITQTHRIVRRWETNLLPRIIPKDVRRDGPQPKNDYTKSREPEVFGFYDSKEKIERGWLTTETAIQLKLFNNHLQMWKSKLQGRKIYVKVTPINLARANSVSQEMTGEDCLSLETMDITDKVDCWPVVEIAVMNQGEEELKFQDQFGRPFSEDDFIIFQILFHELDSVAVLMDFYSYPPRAGEDEPPYHVGFSYILPSAMKHSEGQVVVPITSTRHRPIGQITVEYLVIKPITHFTCDLKCSHQRLWKDSWHGLDVGHRGIGNSFKAGDIRQCAEVRENTIASLKTAASHGADFVEFDVQLSKDLIPVLYHDFYVGIAMKRKKQLAPEEMIQLPVKDLSLEQLHLLKDYKDRKVLSKVLYPKGSRRKDSYYTTEDETDDEWATSGGGDRGSGRGDRRGAGEALYHVAERGTNRFSDEHLEDHQPFPTLKQALEVLDPSVGFDIEMKWTMQLKDGTYELYHPFDLNLYLDTVLEVVLKHGGDRNIVFSCFHPDICTMIRLKQNRYPVMFLTQGITDKYPAYHDPRCQNVPIAVYFAVSMDILGINVHTEDLLRDSSQVDLVKRAGLVLFCWGEDNNDTDTIKYLKNLGIHAVIYDKIDQFSNKEVKESIFRLEARESERVIIRAAAERASSVDDYLHSPHPPHLGSPPASPELIESVDRRHHEVLQDNYNLLEKAREAMTTTSLTSNMSLWSSDHLMAAHSATSALELPSSATTAPS